MDWVKTPAWRPYSELLAAWTASGDLDERHDADHRTEYFLADHPAIRRHIGQDGGFVEGAPALTARVHRRPGGLGLVHPFLDAAGLCLGNQRADVGAAVELRPGSERLGAAGDMLEDPLEERGVHVHALNREAVLAGDPEGSGDDRIGCVDRVGVGADDRGVVAAEFGEDLLGTGRGGNAFGRPGTAGEGDQVDLRRRSRALRQRRDR